MNANGDGCAFEGPNAEVSIQIEGNRYCTFAGGFVPPIGTRIVVHKHMTPDGEFVTVQVTGHEWVIEDGPYLRVSCQTRVVGRETNE